MERTPNQNRIDRGDRRNKSEVRTMELQEACVSAQREISGVHVEISEMIKRLDQLAAKGGGRDEVVPEIRGLHSAVEDLDRKVSDLESQLPASPRAPSEEMPWYEWI